MSEGDSRPPAEFGGPDEQIRWMAATARFLVERPDQPWEERVQVVLPEPEGEVMTANFGLDGESIVIGVPQEETDGSRTAWIWLVDKPQKDEEGDWFATFQKYTLHAPEDPAADPVVEVEQGHMYELFSFLLPEDYEAVREEYEAQSQARNVELPGWGATAIYSFEEFKSALVGLAANVGMQMVSDGEITDGSDISPVYDGVEEMFMGTLETTGLSVGDYYGLRGKLQRAIKELKEEAKNRAEAVALGLNVVSDEERAGLLFKLKILREEPDTHEITSFYRFDLE